MPWPKSMTTPFEEIVPRWGGECLDIYELEFQNDQKRRWMFANDVRIVDGAAGRVCALGWRCASHHHRLC